MTEHLHLTLSRVPWPGPWATRGACRDRAPDLFFGSEGGAPARGGRVLQLMEQAKLVCEACAVRPACREYALTHPDLKWGVWGGMRPDELEHERRRRRADQVVTTTTVTVTATRRA